MRKPGKGKPFTKKDGPTDPRKSAGSRPYRDKTKSDDRGFSGRKPAAKNAEGPRGRDSDRSGERSFFKKDERPERASGSERSFSTRKPYNADDKPRRSFDKSDERPAYKKRSDTERTPERSSPKPERKTKPRSFDDKPRRSFDKPDARPSFKRGASDERISERNSSKSERKPKPRNFDDKPRRIFENSEERASFNREMPAKRSFGSDRKPTNDKVRRGKSGANFDSNARKYGASETHHEDVASERRNAKKDYEDKALTRVKFDDFEDGKVFSNAIARNAVGKKPVGNKTKYKKQTGKVQPQSGDGLTRLNKYLANAGVASRREADTLIQSGVVKVNGAVVDQLGYKISPGDKVTYGDAPVKGERKVYLLLNKPKDYITTVDDPQERKTVMELVSKACKERIYPVGRLDRNTTGLLLFTNDGELTTKLTHPKFGVKKVYHVSLNKGLKPEDFKAIAEGLELEDGMVKADDLAFVGEGKKEIGIEIHSGRNRIVRRIFEHLGYDVLKLDRVVFAGLTKKDLPRGKHRFLTAKEIGFLQMIG